MSEIRIDSVQEYLALLYDNEVKVSSVSPIGRIQDPEKALKEYGYGTPLLIDLEVDESHKRIVYNAVKLGDFGHDTMPVRASILLWEAYTFNNLPKHVRAIDVGAITVDRGLRTLTSWAY